MEKVVDSAKDKTIIATRQDKTRQDKTRQDKTRQDKTRLKVIGRMNHNMDHTHEAQNRVYDISGLSPTINTCGGGNLQPMIMIKDLTNKPNSEIVLQASKQASKQARSEYAKLRLKATLNVI